MSNDICLFDLILYVPVKIFSVMSWRVFLCWSCTKLRITCLAQGHNTRLPVRLEPATPEFLVKHSTTEPLYEQWYDKNNKIRVCKAMTQISLGIHIVLWESLLWDQWVTKEQSVLHVDRQDSDQSEMMSRLIWVFKWHRATWLVFSYRGSHVRAQ